MIHLVALKTAGGKTCVGQVILLRQLNTPKPSFRRKPESKKIRWMPDQVQLLFCRVNKKPITDYFEGFQMGCE